MLDQHDESELLALIEGELDDRQAAALRKRLSNEPRALAMIERMREDRAVLRVMGSPELPEDFVARLEPLLARPMLTEPIEEANAVHYSKPGEFRRQQRRGQVRMRWGRLAAAAVLFLGLLVGTWAAVNGWTGRNLGPGDSIVAVNDSSTDRAAESNATTSDVVAITNLDGTIHHQRPDLNKAGDRLASVLGTPGDSANAPDAGRPPRLAEFAIVIAAGDQAGTEEILRLALESPDDGTAIVRNFNFDEARRLAREWAIAHGGTSGGPSDPMVISAGSSPPRLDNGQYDLLADRVRRQLAESRPQGSTTAAASGQLFGSPALSPSLETQLNLSSRGSTHTITVPAARVHALIEQLAMSPGCATSLCLLPESESAAPDSTPSLIMSDPLTAWLTEGPRVREAIDRLLDESANGSVQIPVIVRSAN